jgi:hypothetical protein
VTKIDPIYHPATATATPNRREIQSGVRMGHVSPAEKAPYSSSNYHSLLDHSLDGAVAEAWEAEYRDDAASSRNSRHR